MSPKKRLGVVILILFIVFGVIELKIFNISIFSSQVYYKIKYFLPSVFVPTNETECIDAVEVYPSRGSYGFEGGCMFDGQLYGNTPKPPIYIK